MLAIRRYEKKPLRFGVRSGVIVNEQAGELAGSG